MMRVLMCGDRNWTDRRSVRSRLNRLLDEEDDFLTIVHGAARGADTIAGEEAEALGLKVEAHPADWRIGPGGGPARNKKMLETGIDLVIAFHDDLSKSKGTADMTRRAEKAGVPVEFERSSDG